MQVYIWYFTDNNEGIDLAGKIAKIGLDVKLIKNKGIKRQSINKTDINILIFDFFKKEIKDIIFLIKEYRDIHDFLKFIFLYKRQLKKALVMSASFSHTEFISRPVNKREFILLLEKSVIIERYREVMMYISEEAEARIEAYESLMDINRGDLFATDKEREYFKNILDYEKNLMEKQAMLNNSIREFAVQRQKEMFYNTNKIRREMFEELRNQEVKGIK